MKKDISCDVMVIRKTRRGQTRRKRRLCFGGVGVCRDVRMTGRLGEFGLQLIKMFHYVQNPMLVSFGVK